MGRSILSLDLLGVPVDVDMFDHRVASRLEALLCDLPRSTATARHRLHLEPEGGRDDRLDLYDGGWPLQAGMTPSEAVTVILWNLNQLALTTADHVVVHAGCVSRDDAGVVLCAPTGAGKSTLVTALVEHGFDYLSDEFAAVSMQDGRLRPSPTPIGLKKGSFALFPHLRPPPWELGDDDSWHVPIRRLRPGCQPGPVRPAAIVMPHYEAVASCDLTPIGPAEALRSVLDQTLNLTILGGEAFRTIGRLVAGVDTYRLVYGDLRDAVAAVGEVAASRHRDAGCPAGGRNAESRPACRLSPGHGFSVASDGDTVQ